jgi:hypothetical protein
MTYSSFIRSIGAVFGVCIVVVSLCLAGTGSAAAQSADIVVATDGSAEYTSIQNAVDNATDGDQIKVKPGTYEQHTEISKNITIYAPNGATVANTSAVISNYGKFEARSGFQIVGDVAPTISGFTLTDWRWAISAGGSEGSWTVKSTKIIGGSCGVCAAGTPGDWSIKNSTITDAGTVSAYQSTGDWEIVNTTIRETNINADKSTGDPEIKNTSLRDTPSNGIKKEEATGTLTIKNSTIQNTTYAAIEAENTSIDIVVSSTAITEAETGIDIEEGSTGDITVRSSTINDIENAAIDADKFSGTVRVHDTSVQTAANGIDAEKSDGQLIVENLTVRDTSGDGIDASNATGNSTVGESVFKNMGDKSIDLIDSEGKWQIHKSILTGGKEGAVDAWDAVFTANASYNYWGAANGPSGQFNGSGGEVGGNIIVTPYYVDSSLTTLSSEENTSSDGDRSAPSITAPADFTYDPTNPLTVETSHDATGVISSDDMAIRVVNVTNNSNTVVAMNDSTAVPSAGSVNTTIPAGQLAGDVTLEIQLYNTSSNAVEATAITNLTAQQDPLVTRFGGSDNEIGNLDVLQAVNAANNGEKIGGERVSNLDILQLVNRATQ